MSVTPHCAIWSVSSSIPPDCGTADTSACHRGASAAPEGEQGSGPSQPRSSSALPSASLEGRLLAQRTEGEAAVGLLWEGAGTARLMLVSDTP